MRDPLNEFAARLVRNCEITEFIGGLIKEHGADPETVVRAVLEVMPAYDAGQGEACTRDARGVAQFARGDVGGMMVGAAMASEGRKNRRLNAVLAAMRDDH